VFWLYRVCKISFGDSGFFKIPGGFWPEQRCDGPVDLFYPVNGEMLKITDQGLKGKGHAGRASGKRGVCIPEKGDFHVFQVKI